MAYIESIKLSNFRNYESLELSFDKGTNIFYGDNAQGKTNILESVYLCGTTKSHKGSKDREMIRFGQEDAHIRMMVKKDGLSYKLDMHLRKNKAKGAAVNGLPVKKARELFGIVNLVFFSPEDLNIIKNGPGERRRFLDLELCQLDQIYLSDLAGYNHIVNQRNRLLKDMYANPSLKDTLEVWDKQMIQYGRKLIRKRQTFVEELNEIISKGVPAPKIKISDRAQMVMPYHILFDQYEEERLGGKSFGSTKSGIAPFYSDKYAKIGFQVNELFDDEHLKEKLKSVCETKNILLEHLYHKPQLNPDEIYAELMEYKKMVEPYVCDTSAFLWNAIQEGKEILLEGQLGSLKDPDHGIYPMVTSSSTLAGYGAVGAGVPPYEIKKIVTVCKAYSSAVGAGAFVSEIFGDEADELRRRGGDGGEFGATTGRPRRMGWLDCVASRYGCRMQGTTDVAFTVLDVLGYLDEIPVCVAYEVDGKEIHDFPNTSILEKAKPVLKTLPGWKCDIRGIKKYEDLPENCRNYIEFVEKEIGFPITMISNGPGRDDIIYRNK